MRLVSPGALRRANVVGMNCRNHEVIMALNDRRFYPRVDDKFETKRLAEKFDIATPTLLTVVRYQHQVPQLFKLLADVPDFVIKPARGAAGRGILVVPRRDDNGGLVKASGTPVTQADMEKHCSNILSGLYSLGGLPDKALVERCIAFTDAFDGFSFQGVPDVRLIVYRGYPIFAMMRLSTAASDGKANLHQGAVGVGIHLHTGRAKRAVQFDQLVHEHPDTQKSFDDLVVPQWQEHLLLATRCAELTQLGYYGADVVLDANHGPQILELNARPGLAIQMANGEGLRTRFAAIDALDYEVPWTPEYRLQKAMEIFAN